MPKKACEAGEVKPAVYLVTSANRRRLACDESVRRG